MSNTAIVGINWGDEGKGRMVDYFADKYQMWSSAIRAATTPAIRWSTNTASSR